MVLNTQCYTWKNAMNFDKDENIKKKKKVFVVDYKINPSPVNHRNSPKKV